jgi:hypothetical protein
VSADYSGTVLAKGPVGYWRLGEATGPTAADLSGNGHDGAYRATPSYGQEGAIAGDADTALKCDGHLYVEVPSSADFSQPTSGQGLTVEAWVRPDLLDFPGQTDPSGDQYVYWLGKGDAGEYEWGFRFYPLSSSRPNRMSAYIWTPGATLGAGAYIPDAPTAGEWIHVVACYSPGDQHTKGAGVRIYKNGQLRQGPPAKATLYSTYHIVPTPGAAPLRLGTRDLESFLFGALDEVAIYPRVLTAQEVMDNYNAGIS